MSKSKVKVIECASYAHQWSSPVEVCSVKNTKGIEDHMLYGLSFSRLGFRLPVGAGKRVRRIKVIIEDLGVYAKENQ
jgi:hypothetical protein